MKIKRECLGVGNVCTESKSRKTGEKKKRWLLRQDFKWRVIENEVEEIVRNQMMSVLEVLFRSFEFYFSGNEKPLEHFK